MNTAGWLLDLYEDYDDGLVLWLLDENNQRCRLTQHFPITLYATGPNTRLRALWQYLLAGRYLVQLERCERQELFAGKPVTVMSITAQGPVQAKSIFADISTVFPDLTYYDADLSPNLRHAALYGTFPLAKVQVEADRNGMIGSIETQDKPWDIEHEQAPLRVMSFEPDSNPLRQKPSRVKITTRPNHLALDWDLPLEPSRPFLINLAALLRRYDPDLILSTWGDTWLLPYLVKIARDNAIPLCLSRDAGRGVGRKKERSYLAYGQMMHIGQQMRLFGRLHIDIYNAMMYHDYGLEGIFESARVSGLPIQTVARSSPGSGISAMQIVVALRQGILVPWRKQAGEKLKSARDLIEADIGGLVYAPVLGVHSHVAELDFTSLYPACITAGSLSPELMNTGQPGDEKVPGTSLTVDRSKEGLIPATIEPLLQKRIKLKNILAQLPNWDPRKKLYKAHAAAHKWLLVTCFGYLGYKNARFGRIEAHMATTAYGREALMQAKEAAEDMGYRVLGLYVDAIWVTQPGHQQAEDFQPLLKEITARTTLPIALEGVYKWLAFLSSRMDPRVSVANRYFGAFQDGSTKIRGIELRRRDTPGFIAETQEELIAAMTKAPSAEALKTMLPELVAIVRRKVKELYAGKIQLEDLVVIQKLSRELEAYRTPSPAAVAASQLAHAGKQTRPGENVSLLFTRGDPGARAWYLPGKFDRAALDLPRYRTLLIRAAWSILGPVGISEKTLEDWALDKGVYRLEKSPIPLEQPPLLVRAHQVRAELIATRVKQLYTKAQSSSSLVVYHQARQNENSLQNC